MYVTELFTRIVSSNLCQTILTLRIIAENPMVKEILRVVSVNDEVRSRAGFYGIDRSVSMNETGKHVSFT